MVLARLHYTIHSALFLALFTANFFVWQSPIVGGALLLIFFLLFGAHLGWRVAPHTDPRWQTLLGGMILGSAIIVLGTALYYIAFLPRELWALFVLLTPPAVWLLTPTHPGGTWGDLWHGVRRRLEDRNVLAIVSAVILLFAALGQIILRTNITDALRTPWDAFPAGFFWLAALLFFALAALCLHGRERALSLPMLTGAFFLTVGIAAFVYPIGYGFDSFLHQATEDIIAREGTISPKPLYYIGQYVAVLFASQGFSLPLALVDRFLLPVLAALLLPLTWYFSAASIGNDKRHALFSTLGLFLLPLSPFIVTTPQGLGNLLVFLLVLASIPFLSSGEGLRLPGLALLATAALATHPIAGIPAVLYMLLIAVKRRRWQMLIVAGGSIALPIMFILQSWIAHLPLSFDLSKLSPVALLSSMHLGLLFKSGFDTWLDFAYVFSGIIIPLLAVLAIYILWRTRNTMPHRLRLPALMALILLINEIILSASVNFTFLIDYERANYAARLVPLMAFFLAPYLMLFLERGSERAMRLGLPIRVGIVLLFTGLLTSQLYLTYPRRDNYETSHGFNTSAADLEAARFINEDAPEDYVVLANQQVAAGAVSLFGFRRYYGDVFYYPIPTGGPLYRLFLKMNERPERATVEAAMQLAGVHTAYYVVDDYWWQAPRLIETAKLNADGWIAIGDGKVHVFRYNFVPLKK